MDGRTSNEWRVAKQQPQQKPSEALGLTDHIDSAGLGLTSCSACVCTNYHKSEWEQTISYISGATKGACGELEVFSSC